MSPITYEVHDKDDERVITGDWNQSAASFVCEISPRGSNNSDGHFMLDILGGQVEKGSLKMFGSLERDELIATLEVILRELKNIK